VPITQTKLEQTIGLIPRGVADYFWHEAHQRRKFQHELLEVFRSWGYGDIILPSFEYADTLSSHATSQVAQQMYRFPDRDGTMLALRTDMTISVARLVGTRLYDSPMPQRYCYAGNVFRYVDQPKAGRQREFAQVGIELIGAQEPAADGEILALCAQAIQNSGLQKFQMVLGQIGYVDGLMAELTITPQQRTQLLQAIQRNSQPLLQEILQTASLTTEQRHTLENIPLLSGYAVPAIFEKAGTLCLNQAMEDALANLRKIYDTLVAYSVDSHCYLDMTEISNLGYYTGLTFEILAPELGFPIASGGRYDRLVGSFGLDQPAVGAAIGLDRLLLACQMQNTVDNKPYPMQPDLLVAASQDGDCLQIVQGWRAAGIRVVIDVNNSSKPELLNIAQQREIPYVLVWDNDNNGFVLYDHPEDAESSLFIPAAESQKIMEMLRDNE